MNREDFIKHVVPLQARIAELEKVVRELVRSLVIYDDLDGYQDKHTAIHEWNELRARTLTHAKAVSKETSLVAAIGGDLSKMDHADLVLTCQMLTRGRQAWRDEAEQAQHRIAELEKVVSGFMKILDHNNYWFYYGASKSDKELITHAKAILEKGKP